MNHAFFSVSYFKRLSAPPFRSPFSTPFNLSGQIGFPVSASSVKTITLRSVFEVLNSIDAGPLANKKDKSFFDVSYQKFDTFFQTSKPEWPSDSHVFLGLGLVLKELRGSFQQWADCDFKPIHTLSVFLKHPELFLKLINHLESVTQSQPLPQTPKSKWTLSRFFCMLTDPEISDPQFPVRTSTHSLLGKNHLFYLLWDYHKENTSMGAFSISTIQRSVQLCRDFSQLDGAANFETNPYKDFFQRVDEFNACLKSDAREKKRQIKQGHLESIRQLLSQLEMGLAKLDPSLQEVRDTNLANQASLIFQLKNVLSDLTLMNTYAEALRESFQAQRQRSLTPVLAGSSEPVACALLHSPWREDPATGLSASIEARLRPKIQKQERDRYLSTLDATQDSFFQKKEESLKILVFQVWNQQKAHAFQTERFMVSLSRRKTKSQQALGFLGFSLFLERVKASEKIAKHLYKTTTKSRQAFAFDAFAFQVQSSSSLHLEWGSLTKRYLKFDKINRLKSYRDSIRQQNRQKISEVTLLADNIKEGLARIDSGLTAVSQAISLDATRTPSYFKLALDVLSQDDAYLDHPFILALFLSDLLTPDPYAQDFYKAFYKKFNFQFPTNGFISLDKLLGFYEQLKRVCSQDHPDDFPEFDRLSLDSQCHNVSAASIFALVNPCFSNSPQSLTLKELAFFDTLFREFLKLQSSSDFSESNEVVLAEQANLFLNALKTVSTPRLAKKLSSKSFINQIADALQIHFIDRSITLDTFVNKLTLFVEIFFQRLLPPLSDTSSPTPLSFDECSLDTCRSNRSLLTARSSDYSSNHSSTHSVPQYTTYKGRTSDKSRPNLTSIRHDWFLSFKHYSDDETRPLKTGRGSSGSAASLPPTGSVWYMSPSKD